MVLQRVIIDAKRHVFGRLASIVAKSLLQGDYIVVLRCEEIVLSGPFFRQKLRWRRKMRKRMNTNPSRGPFHFRSPSQMFFRCVRGMVRHKTKRGQIALSHLKVFEGVPAEYQTKKVMRAPQAHSINIWAPYTKSCTLSRLAHENGWKYRDVVNSMEEARKIKGKVAWEERQKKRAKLAEAKKQLKESGEYAKILEFVEQYHCEW